MSDAYCKDCGNSWRMCCCYEKSYATAPKFQKHDSGKLRWSLLPLESLEEVVKVLEHGAKKYSDDNWRNCEEIVRYYDAALRHLVAWKRGERFDPESSLPHLSHAIASIMFLLALDVKE